MVSCYVQTMPGVEKIAWLEIRDRLQSASFGQYLFAKDQNGILCFEHTEPLSDLQNLRTVEDVFLVALQRPKMNRSRRDLSLITRWVAHSEEFGRAANEMLRYRKFSRPPSYRVISRKYGKHDYRRKDLETAVAAGLAHRYPRWQPVAEGGQVEIWANLLGSHLLIGLRLSDRTMRHRHRKRVELPASLRPSVAAAMVYLTEPARNDVFLDPMCGSGTLLLERRAAGPYGLILAGDVVPERAAAAARNAGRRRKKRGPQSVTLQWDAARLPLADGTVDKIATNLPFGRRVTADLRQLYPAFFAEAARVLRSQGVAVVLSSEYDLVKESVRAQPRLQILTGYSIAVLGQWGRIYIVQKKGRQ